MNYEDLKWINQSLYSYKDKQFDSQGYLDISVNLNTSDNINFSQPKLVFNLDNLGQKRHVRLSYSNVIDLLRAFNDMAKGLNEVFKNKQTGAITRRYNSNKDFVFEFQMLNDMPIVRLIIKHNDSDAGKIIFPFYPEFETLGYMIRLFKDNYIKFTTDLPSRYLTSLSTNRLERIEHSIKVLPSQLVPIQHEQYPDRREEIEPSINAASSTDIKYTGTRCANCGEDQFDTPSGVTCKNGHGGADSIDDAAQANEFEQFALEEEPKVRIPELESDALEPREAIAQEYKSPFIERTLKNNILNLQEMLYALFTNNNPLRTIMDTINEGQGYTLLPGITEKDLKSVLYISNLYFKMNFHSYIKNQTGFPSAIPVVKYLGSDEDRATIELSYDLMMISAYLKLYRNRMESINSDPYSNGALVHFSFRCYLDVATYSYLHGKNPQAIKNTVVSRFKYFRETGFFDNFDKNLEGQNQKKIYDSEIGEFIDKVFDNVVESDDINIRHFNAHDAGSVKLPPDNKFNSEQITNEIVKYEIKSLFGERIENLTNDEDIILLFNKKLKKKIKPTDHRPEKRKTETHVLRYVKLKANELAEVVRQPFIDYVESIGDQVYDFYNDVIKIEELPEVILQTVYTWNENYSEKMKYTDFVLTVEECISKDLIISKIKELSDETDAPVEDSGWGDALGEIEL
jgi:hypothetical protein